VHVEGSGLGESAGSLDQLRPSKIRENYGKSAMLCGPSSTKFPFIARSRLRGPAKIDGSQAVRSWSQSSNQIGKQKEEEQTRKER